MKKYIFLIALMSIGFYDLIGQEKFPIIKGYGGIVDVDSEFSPDPTQKYKLIFDVTLRASDPATVNAGLDGVARVINLHAYAGVPKENIHVVVAVRQGATYSVLGNDFYHGKFEVDNPNLDLIKQLKAAGVDMFVCGQNLKRGKIEVGNVVDEVKVALSAFTTTTHFRMKGYAYYKF